MDTFPSGGEFVYLLHEMASFNPACVILRPLHARLERHQVTESIVARARPHLPVIFLTGADDTRILEAARGSGAFAVLDKPPDAGLLTKTIHAALGADRPEGPGATFYKVPVPDPELMLGAQMSFIHHPLEKSSSSERPASLEANESVRAAILISSASMRLLASLPGPGLIVCVLVAFCSAGTEPADRLHLQPATESRGEVDPSLCAASGMGARPSRKTWRESQTSAS